VSPKQRHLPRCAYVEGRRRCARAGRGDPPLCPTHEVLLDEPPPLSLDDVLDDLFGRAEDLAVRMANKMKRDLRGLARQPAVRVAAERAAAPQPRVRPHQPPRRPPPSPQRPSIPEPDPRDVLGFAPGAKLTREIVKSRQRELAKIFHPDRQGSTAAMQRLNSATKKLLETL
jgi:hypothetical protein